MSRSLLLFLILVMAASPLRAEWSGQVATKDGKKFVVNPETPMQTASVKPASLWERGGEDDDLLFGRIAQIVADGDGNIYILDSQLSEITVLDPDGEFLRTVGREGEGPGEFNSAVDCYLGPDDVLGVVRIFPGKVIQIVKDGTPAGNLAFPGMASGEFQLVYSGQGTPNHIVIAGAVQRYKPEGGVQITQLKAHDKDGAELVQYHEESQPMQFGGHTFDEKTFTNFTSRWALSKDGSVAASLDYDTYKVHVWNADGTLRHVIDRPQHQVLKRTGKQMERFQKMYDGFTSWNPNSTFKVASHHPALVTVAYRDNGNLWVLSSRSIWDRKDGLFASYDEYDGEGRFVRRVDVQMDGDPVEDGIFFAADRMYVVTDLFGAFMALVGGDTEESEDTEPLRLIAYELDVPTLGMR